MKVSFDFDGTLSQESVQKLAEHLINLGDDVWIVTSRLDKVEWNKDLFSVAEYLGIRDKILFTGGDYKYVLLNKHKFELHFDDDYLEIKNIFKKCESCAGVHVFDTFNEID